MQKQYIISPVTLYDADELLWYTKVGVEGGHIPLHYTVWGKTEAESRDRSEMLVGILQPRLLTKINGRDLTNE